MWLGWAGLGCAVLGEVRGYAELLYDSVLQRCCSSIECSRPRCACTDFELVGPWSLSVEWKPLCSLQTRLVLQVLLLDVCLAFGCVAAERDALYNAQFLAPEHFASQIWHALLT